MKNQGDESQELSTPTTNEAPKRTQGVDAAPPFTPAPWAVGEGGFHVYYVNPQIEAGEDIEDERHDSIVAMTDGMGAFSGIPDEERQANARLIAAAPELLAAAKESLGFLKVLEMFTDDMTEGRREAFHAIQKMLGGAIRKAQRTSEQKG